MPVFTYAGIDKQGNTVRGTLTADSPRDGRDQLRQQGIRPRSLDTTADASRDSIWNRIRTRHARHLWGGAAHELSMLLRAGISIDEAIQTIASQYRGAFRDSLQRLHAEITAGRSVADAMSDQPMIYDAASIRLVEVGENAGNLEVVLDEIADFKQRISEFGDKIVNALLYPAFLLVFGSLAMIFLMTWVLPPLLENLEETVDQIPWPTRVAKAISDVLVNHFWKLLVASVAGLLALVAWSRSHRGKRWLHRVSLKLPVIGPILTKQHVARSSMVIGLLLRSGIPLNQSLDLAARSTSNQTVVDCLREGSQNLTAGRDLADSLSKDDVFPPLAVRVFSVGQDSGQLDEMLIRLGNDYNQQVQLAATRLTTLLEPILILVMAVLVGFLLVATILPILQAGKMV